MTVRVMLPQMSIIDPARHLLTGGRAKSDLIMLTQSVRTPNQAGLTVGRLKAGHQDRHIFSTAIWHEEPQICFSLVDK